MIFQKKFRVIPGPKIIKKNTNSTPNKSQTQRARAYKVTSFLSTDCALAPRHVRDLLIVLGPIPTSKVNSDFWDFFL